MKNIFKLLSLASIVCFGLVSCDEAELITYDPVNGQTGIGYTIETANIVVPEEGISVTLTVESTKTTSAARDFNVVVDESSTASASDYTLGTLSIPANSYSGSMDVTFGNYDNLVDFETNTLVLKLETGDGLAIVGSQTATINYIKFFACNDFVLTLNEDVYADERTWEIADATGAVVLSAGPYPRQPSGGGQFVEEFSLPDGCYTFTIIDAYGDGQFDGNTTGSYTLIGCGILDIAAGSGNWGASESTEFCVN